jgi:hypothetical protein
MKIVVNIGYWADAKNGTLTVPESGVYPISSRVRTLSAGTRMSHEVVRSIPAGKPYDPRSFPVGIWRVTGLDWQKDKRFDPRTYGPVKILTDAWQAVRVWELDEHGDYFRETEEATRDEGYWLHYSASKTTLGCVRLDSTADAIAVANAVQRAWDRGETVELEVNSINARL